MVVKFFLLFMLTIVFVTAAYAQDLAIGTYTYKDGSVEKELTLNADSSFVYFETFSKGQNQQDSGYWFIACELLIVHSVESYTLLYPKRKKWLFWNSRKEKAPIKRPFLSTFIFAGLTYTDHEIIDLDGSVLSMIINED